MKDLILKIINNEIDPQDLKKYYLKFRINIIFCIKINTYIF